LHQRSDSSLQVFGTLHEKGCILREAARDLGSITASWSKAGFGPGIMPLPSSPSGWPSRPQGTVLEQFVEFLFIFDFYEGEKVPQP